MSARADIAWSKQLAGTNAAQVTLWAGAAALMLALHLGAGWWAVRERPLPMEDDAAPAIMIDLADMAMAPEAVEEQVAMDEVETVAAEEVEAVEPVEPLEEIVEPVEPVEPIEPEVVETEPEPEIEVAQAEVVEPEVEEPIAEVVVPTPTPRPRPPERVRERPVERPREQARPRPQQPSVQRNRAQAQTTRPAPRAAAPQAASGSGSAVSPARWQSRVMAHLERRKRYPAEARRARRQGTAQVRFTIDSGGNVRSVSLARSSGSPDLDAEVLSMVRRASPIPAPPPGVSRTIVVPVRFTLR